MKQFLSNSHFTNNSKHINFLVDSNITNFVIKYQRKIKSISTFISLLYVYLLSSNYKFILLQMTKEIYQSIRVSLHLGKMAFLTFQITCRLFSGWQKVKSDQVLSLLKNLRMDTTGLRRNSKSLPGFQELIVTISVTFTTFPKHPPLKHTHHNTTELSVSKRILLSHFWTSPKHKLFLCQTPCLLLLAGFVPSLLYPHCLVQCLEKSRALNEKLKSELIMIEFKQLFLTFVFEEGI